LHHALQKWILIYGRHPIISTVTRQKISASKSKISRSIKFQLRPKAQIQQLFLLFVTFTFTLMSRALLTHALSHSSLGW
jgi:hypothetical protein